MKKNAALQIDSEGIELVTHRHLHGSFDWFSQRMLLFTLHTFEIDEPDGRIWDVRLMPSDCSNFEDEKTAAQCTVILQIFGEVLFSVFSVVIGFTEIKKTPK